MKKFFTFLLTLLVAFQLFATDWTSIRSAAPAAAEKQLIYSTIETSEIRFSLDGFFSQQVITPRGEAVVIHLDRATPLLEAGSPDLPKLTASLIIPDLAEMSVEVVSSNYMDLENIFIAPSKGNLYRDTDPASVPYTFGEAYETDAFFPGTLAGHRDPHIVRDHRGQTVIVYPFQYNPVTRTLRVYYDITVRLSKVSDNGLNPLVRQQEPEKVDAQFYQLYNRHFLNASSGGRYTPVEEYGNILVISYGAFQNAMEPWVEWRKQVGYPVEMVDVATIGNSTAIKTFIANYYNTKGLTFVLLVGDAAQVPTSSTSAGDSDNNYSYVVGNDHYPDLFIGRFSAENEDQVNTQVERTLTYEQDPPMDVDWFTICTGIASNQGPGDDGEYDYEHIRNIHNNKLIPWTYTYGNELFDGSQGGNDDPGNPSPSQVAADVNAGTSVINYTGHGSTTSWGSSGFSNSDVNNLVNDNKLPFVFSVACVNGNFVNSTCFAEAWLRATNNGEPTGAIAFLGSTINQSWNPPMCGQDEMNDVMAETYADNYKRTFGAISMHGCMLMNDEYGAGGDEMTDTWTCFGDPSVMVRSAMPQTMTVTHDPVLLLGFDEFTITCDVEEARATLTMDGSMLATGVVEGGTVTLTFASLATPGTATLTVTGFNCMPYIVALDVIPADGPFLVLESYDINDEGGNNNGLADYNESIKLAVEMENVGVEDATDVTMTLSTNDPYITITDASEVFPVVPAGGTTTIEDAFGFNVASDVPDQHPVNFTLSSTDGDNNWQSTFIMNANAPVLHINSLTIDDVANGNGNGELDPGEEVEMMINYTNTGHAIAYDVDVYLEGQSGFVEVLDPNQHFQSIGFLGVFNKTYSVTVDEESPEGICVHFMNELSMGDLFMEQDFPKKISAKCEDFETGDFSKFNWQHGGNLPWDITYQYVYEGNYCIKSGPISHGQSSEISMTYQVMEADSIVFFRKVSSEPADKLKFYINNTLIEEWSGTTTGWKRQSYPVGPGIKTFKWVYQKSNSGSTGADCAWIDFVVLPPPVALTIWAGPNDQSCSGDSFQLIESYGTDYATIEWNTSGTGTFDDNTIMHPVYIPGQEDLLSGTVNLSLLLTDDEGNSVTDEMDLSFMDEPEAAAMPQGPEQVDPNITPVTEYTTQEIEGAENYNWYLVPEFAGTISGTGINASVSWSPDFIGTASVTVAGENQCGEGEISPALEVTVDVVGIDEPASEGINLSIYPNPTSGILNIRILRTEGDPSTISIYNILGSKMMELDGSGLQSGQILSLDVSDLPKGLYILSVQGQQGRSDRKLIVK
jgi:hypothetical protein